MILDLDARTFPLMTFLFVVGFEPFTFRLFGHLCNPWAMGPVQTWRSICHRLAQDSLSPRENIKFECLFYYLIPSSELETTKMKRNEEKWWEIVLFPQQWQLVTRNPLSRLKTANPNGAWIGIQLLLKLGEEYDGNPRGQVTSFTSASFTAKFLLQL